MARSDDAEEEEEDEDDEEEAKSHNSQQKGNELAGKPVSGQKRVDAKRSEVSSSEAKLETVDVRDTDSSATLDSTVSDHPENRGTDKLERAAETAHVKKASESMTLPSSESLGASRKQPEAPKPEHKKEIVRDEQDFTKPPKAAKRKVKTKELQVSISSANNTWICPPHRDIFSTIASWWRQIERTNLLKLVILTLIASRKFRGWEQFEQLGNASYEVHLLNFPREPFLRNEPQIQLRCDLFERISLGRVYRMKRWRLGKNIPRVTPTTRCGFHLQVRLLLQRRDGPF